MCGVSKENAGIFNYTKKRDIRRWLDREIRSEGYDPFNPKPGQEAVMPVTAEDITLITSVQNPNGHRAVVVGAKSKLWRYYGLDDALYVADTQTPGDGYYEPGTFVIAVVEGTKDPVPDYGKYTPGAFVPRSGGDVDDLYVEDDYFSDDSSQWLEIGSGFNGKRWEALNINGYLWLNNGVDLPVTYRERDVAATPVYELRENGIASIGSIAEHNGVPICLDVRQLKDANLKLLKLAVDGDVDAEVVGSVKAVNAVVNSGVTGVSGNTLTAVSDDFNSGAGFVGMEGQAIRMTNGLKRTIAAVVSPTVATLDGDAGLAEPSQPFYIVSATGTRVTPDAETLFVGLDLSNPAGLELFWESGESRTVTGISGGYLLVNSDKPIPSGPVKIQNPNTYRAITDDNLLDLYQWRMLWGMPDEPRRFGAVVTGTVTPTSNIVTLDAPTKSFSVGQKVKVVNTSESGMGSVTGAIIHITPTELFLGDSVITNAGQVIVDQVAAAKKARDDAASVLASARTALAAAQKALDDAETALASSPADPDLIKDQSDASATVSVWTSKVSEAEDGLDEAQAALDEAEKLLEPTAVDVEADDAAASIIAFEDLIDDGSAILRGMTLRNFFIIYKETGIYIARYTGTTAQPFVFEHVPIPMSAALKFKHTLVDVGGMFHFFATNNGFYRFDMTNRVPIEIPELTVCKELFFTQARVEDEPFAANNSATREVFICIPNSSQDDSTIRYDYMQGTVSTTSMTMTAAATVPKPTDPSNRTLPDLWFVMGGNAGALRRYGFVDGPEVVSGSIKATVNNGVATATAPIFSEEHVGRSIRFSGGMVFAIIGYTSPTEVDVMMWKPITLGQTFRIINAIWHRAGDAYESVLESGLESFGAPQSEKMLNEYVLLLSSKSVGAIVYLAFLTGLNPSESDDETEAEIKNPLTSNMIPTVIQANYLGDRITIGGVNNPLEISGRLLKVGGINSSNFNRHP